MEEFDSEKFRDEIYNVLKDLDEQSIRLFALRNALRFSIGLYNFPVKGDKESRKYFFILYIRLVFGYIKVYEIQVDRIVTSDVSTSALESYDASYGIAYDASFTAASSAYVADNASYEAASNDIDYAANAYAITNKDFLTIYKKSVEKDLIFLKDKDYKSLKSSGIFYDYFNDIKVVKSYFVGINPSYQVFVDNLFKPAIESGLDAIEPKFIEAFIKVADAKDDYVLKRQDGVVLADFIADYMAENVEEQKEARVILLGNGGAGKTSLVKNIKEKGSCEVGEKSTPRIEISSQDIDGIHVKFWDFGGQVIMHSTHTFFLSSRSLYIVVCNHRLDEQPDAWLDMLKTRLKSDNKQRVIIVYTHCDEKPEIENDTFFRKNTLERLYGNKFELSYFAISNTSLDGKCDKCFDDAYERLKKEVLEQIHNEAKQVSSKTYKEMFDEHEKNIYTYKELKELKDAIEKEHKADEKSFFEVMVDYGYIFSANPKKKSNEFDDKSKFIRQKHWLTYGVYELINSDITKSKNGTLKRSDFDEILKNGCTSYIDAKGIVCSGKNEDGRYEEIVYDKDGIDLLYEIVHNYRWAILSNKRVGEMIFPHAVSLDEPKNLSEYLVDANSENTRILHVIFDILPKDLFFRFVALCEKHIDNPELLWRKGVVLFDFMDEKTFATVMMQNNKMLITVSGKHYLSLMQFISNYILMLLREYKNIEARILQGIKDANGKLVMVDINLMSILDADGDAFISNVHKSMKESSVANTFNFNINGNVENVVGEGTINSKNRYNITHNITKIINELEKLEKTDDLQAFIDEGKSIQNEPESQSKTKRALEWMKNLATFDKAKDIVAGYGGELAQMAMEKMPIF
jgi:GTPase SAR1 family protein